MESLLKDIYSVVGVTGTFVCGKDGNVLAQIMPENFEATRLAVSARVVGQTFQALETTGHPIEDVDLAYDKGRLLLKNLQGGVLAIVCARNVNVPLLNLTASVTVQKLAEQLKSAAPEPVASGVQPAPATDLPPLVAEMEQEIHRLLEAGKHYRLRLRVMGTMATWLACPNYRTLLIPPENKSIELGGFLTDAYTIELLGEQMGYQINRRYNTFYGNRRMNFSEPRRGLNVDLILDHLEMYHKLDLAPFLTQEEFLLPTTAVLLTRLQIVEMTDPALREICALMLEYDLGVGQEKSQIDASYIMQLCADDWGWFKTVSMNLGRLSTFAATQLEASRREMVIERAQRLKRSLDSAPKSLRWLARARLGDSARWYDTPQVFRPNATRPDMAFG